MIGLKYLRMVNELSLQQVADVLNISKQVISKWENGTVIPKARVEQLMKLFNVNDKQRIVAETENTSKLEEVKSIYKKKEYFLNINKLIGVKKEFEVKGIVKNINIVKEKGKMILGYVDLEISHPTKCLRITINEKNIDEFMGLVKKNDNIYICGIYLTEVDMLVCTGCSLIED